MMVTMDWRGQSQYLETWFCLLWSRILSAQGRTGVRQSQICPWETTLPLGVVPASEVLPRVITQDVGLKHPWVDAQKKTGPGKAERPNSRQGPWWDRKQFREVRFS